MNPPGESFLICPHSEICSVCSWIQISLKEQKDLKLEAFRQSLLAKDIQIPPNIAFLSPAHQGLRDRVDLTFENGNYGFYRKDRKEIFPIEACPLMSNELFAFFKDIQKISLPIQRGSLRLRVSPSGKRGLWLDFANEDVRDLLAERKTLQAFLDLAFVEIGQRRKKLGDKMKLLEPEFQYWTRTWVQGQALDLFSTVGSFSQAGDLANQTLISELESFFTQSQCKDWVEFGAGTGNLTFPLASGDRKVTALEIDRLALAALEKTLSLNPDFQNRIRLLGGDFQQKASYPFQKEQGVLVNPPRSGLKNFLLPLKALPPQERPHDFIYMSCFLESFTEDAFQLQALGYKIKQASLVDQFPHSPHFEILSRWSL